MGGQKVKHYHTALISVAFIASVLYFTVKAEANIEFLPLIAFIPLFINIRKVYTNESPPLLDPELKKVALSTFLFALLFLLTVSF